eukprot:CAMPEP_0182464778 /NCGR_PEP_ID=MMETSP1319-20130603/8824_1 /TAXON_ID=172717 /ORGANISM="Bolidomonas pacifica, Strain RCC208" /LENGTH=267 /DNA_ID=CAMNT_0024664439 /DNA_START=106 /DNA_END=906 /DNA_ORIENTATION=+
MAEKGNFLGSKVLASSPRVSSTSIMNLPYYSLLFPPMRCVNVNYYSYHSTLTTLRSTPKDYGFHPRAQQNNYSLQAQYDEHDGDSQSQSTPTLGNNVNDINNDNNLNTPVDEGLNLFASFDRWGLSLKQRASDALSLSASAPTPSRRLLLSLKFCALTSLFISYRAYRGFFKILPAVFNEVRDKLAATIDYRPFVDDDLAGTLRTVQGRVALGPGEPTTPAADDARPKATVTVTFLALALTLSYALRGLFGVFFSMVKAAAGGRDVR